MISPLPQVYPTDRNRTPCMCSDVLPALRGLLSQHPGAARCAPEAMARAVYVMRYLPFRPPVLEIEAALGALRVEGEVLA
jgi:hypothetical protein